MLEENLLFLLVDSLLAIFLLLGMNLAYGDEIFCIVVLSTLHPFGEHNIAIMLLGFMF